MSDYNSYAHKGFKYGMLAIGLLLVLIVLSILINTLKSDIVSILIGLLTFVMGILSIVGLFNSIKGIKEPNTAKKIIGMIINFGALLLFLSAIIANVYDIYTALFN